MSLGVQFGAVLAAARTGAEWALAALYREYHPGLLRYLRALEPNDGEDLVSEMGPVIGTHAGPGLIGVTALRGELLGPL